MSIYEHVQGAKLERRHDKQVEHKQQGAHGMTQASLELSVCHKASLELSNAEQSSTCSKLAQHMSTYQHSIS